MGMLSWWFCILVIMVCHSQNTEQIRMFSTIFYIPLLKDTVKGKVCNLAYLAPTSNFPTLWRYMLLICIFILFCFVLCAHLTLICSPFFQQLHSAFYCLRSLGLASSLGFAVEHSCKASWIAHQRSTLLVSGIIATILCFTAPHGVFALLTKVLSYRAQNRAFPALCQKAGFFSPPFFLMDKSNLYYHFLSLKSAIVSPHPNPTEWVHSSSAKHLLLLYLDVSPSNAPSSFLGLSK